MASSITERLAGDARTMNGAGYALMLQVGHPVVGAGVAEHSNFQVDPWGRLIRTLDYVNVTVFGDAESAAAMGTRTREMHKRIKGVLPSGERYHSLTPGPFTWVHATLADAILRSNELFVASPSMKDREAFYADWRELGGYVGVRDRDLPERYVDFRDYVEQTEADVLGHNETVQLVFDSLTRPARPLALLPRRAWHVLRWPPAHVLRLTTVGMLRPVARERLGLPWSSLDAAQFAALARAQRLVTPLMPPQAKSFGRAYLGWRREALEAQGFNLGGAQPATASGTRRAAA